MDAKEMAVKLDNIQYPVRLSEEIKNLAKDNGLVIVYGASDDLMELDGAIYDEIGCYDGGVALIDSKGLLPERENIDDDDELQDYFERRNDAKKIEALWCKEDGYSWTYKTDIPHETFEVMEDDDHYCRGIIFALTDIQEVL